MTILYDDATPEPRGHRDIDPKSVSGALDKIRIVDVREPHEYTGELGHVPGAELVPLGSVEAAAHDWDKEQELVLVCRSGARSGRVAAALTAAGFARVMNMVGGMIAWNEAELPTER